MKVLRKILHISFITTCIASVVFFGLLSLHPEKPLFLKQVLSGSMAPKVPIESVLLILRAKSEAIRPGDIINFNTNDKQAVNVTHRVLEVNRSNGELFFKTKGDANSNPDVDAVPFSRVNGKVILAVPYLGYLYSFIRQPIGLFLLVFIPAVYIIISECFIVIRSVKKNKNSLRKNSNMTQLSILFLISGLMIRNAGISSTHSYLSSLAGLTTVFSVELQDDGDTKHCPPANDNGNTNDNGNGHDNNCDGNKEVGNNKGSASAAGSVASVESTLSFSEGRHYVSFSVQNLEPYVWISYDLTYSTDSVEQGFSGSDPLFQQSEYSKKNIILGSTSSNGTSVYHTGVHDLSLTVRLKSADGSEKILEKSLK